MLQIYEVKFGEYLLLKCEYIVFLIGYSSFLQMVFVDTAEYLFAVLGGALLGVAASLNYVLRGKVTGMSGVLYGVVSLNKGNSLG